MVVELGKSVPTEIVNPFSDSPRREGLKKQVRGKEGEREKRTGR